jgi:hypothetical protein
MQPPSAAVLLRTAIKFCQPAFQISDASLQRIDKGELHDPHNTEDDYTRLKESQMAS